MKEFVKLAQVLRINFEVKEGNEIDLSDFLDKVADTNLIDARIIEKMRNALND